MFGIAPTPTSTTSAGRCTVGELDPGDPVAAGQPGDADPTAQRRAVLGVQPRYRSAELGPERPGQRGGRGLDHGHLETELAGGRGDLGTDEPGADDGEPGAVAELVPQCQRVVESTQHMHTGHRFRARPLARTGSGGDHDTVGADPGTVLELHRSPAASSRVAWAPSSQRAQRFSSSSSRARVWASISPARNSFDSGGRS